MRLTKTMRDAFVRAALDDVPTTDYVEVIRKVATDDFISQLPRAVRAVFDNAATRDWVRTAYLYVGQDVPRIAGESRDFMGTSVTVPAMTDDAKLTTKGAAEVQRLAVLEDARLKQLSKLRQTLRGAANAFSTRKALADALPEFAKYLPPDAAAADRELPVIANIVTDFVNAGWPKGAKPKSRRQALAA